MRQTIRNYVEAANKRREEKGEEGFSLIELIIVVVILGILVAIAIPIFINIQEQAAQNAVRAAAANGATAAAAAFAGEDVSGATTVAPASAAESAGSNGITVSLDAGTNVTDVCVSATDGTYTYTAGPGSTSDAEGASC